MGAELGMTFPIPRPLMSTAVDILYDNSNFKTLYNRQIGTAGTDYGGQMLYTYVSMRIELDNRRGNVGNLELLEHQARWQKFMLEMNADAPSSMKGGVVTSTTWTAADTEQGLIDSTLQTWAISNGGVLLVILLFTQNLLISTYAMLTIVLIVISLLGFLFAIVGFEFGAIEAVGVTIFVGMSVDYCLHVAHGYHSSESITKKEKTTEALTALGVSILGAALTTASSSAFLFPCRIYLFVQLGIMLTSNTILAVFFALMFLVALLMLAGPTRVSKDHHRQWCDVVSVLLCDCLRCSNYGKAAKMSHK